MFLESSKNIVYMRKSTDRKKKLINKRHKRKATTTSTKVVKWRKNITNKSSEKPQKCVRPTEISPMPELFMTDHFTHCWKAANVFGSRCPPLNERAFLMYASCCADYIDLITIVGSHFTRCSLDRRIYYDFMSVSVLGEQFMTALH